MRRDHLPLLESQAGGTTRGSSAEKAISGGTFKTGRDAVPRADTFAQPWTASNASHEQTDAEKAKKLEVRFDLPGISKWTLENANKYATSTVHENRSRRLGKGPHARRIKPQKRKGEIETSSCLARLYRRCLVSSRQQIAASF